MSPDLILHIGANKTGSTAIQHFLCRNLKAIRGLGFQIPSEDLDWSGQVTAQHVSTLQAMIDAPDGAARITERFEALMRDRPADGPVLVSAENLSNLGNAALFAQVCRAHRTKVILYIRRQDDLIASSWQQWHSKYQTDFDAWLVKGLQTIGHWDRIIAGWEAVAGEGAVEIRIFEREEFPDGNVEADFLSVLGVAPSAAAFTFTTHALNPTYSEFITPLVSGNAAIFKDPHDSDFYDLVSAFTGDRYTKGKRISVFSRSQRNAIIAFYEQQNHAVCRKHFPKRARLFKHVEHVKYLYLDEAQIRQEQLQFLTHMVFEMGRRIQALEAAKGGSRSAVPAKKPLDQGRSKPGRAWWGK